MNNSNFIDDLIKNIEENASEELIKNIMSLKKIIYIFLIMIIKVFL